MIQDPAMLALIAVTFLVAGGVKGVIGLGLPTVSLGLLTAALDLTSAMALMVVPSLVTNLWQAATGGHLSMLLRRLWPFFLAATVTIWLGAEALASVRLSWLSGLLGALLVIYAGTALAGLRLSIGPGSERCAGPALGIVNGILTGMTGSFVVPGVLFLQAIGLSRDALVQAMGILFTLSTAALALALQGHGLWTTALGLTSLAALVPAVLGLMLGQRLRRRLSETVFRRLSFVAILVLGLYIVTLSAGI